MAFSSIASPASGFVVKSNIISTCETITIKSAIVSFPCKNTRSSRLVVKAAEEDKSKPLPIKPKRAAKRKKLNTKRKVLADESNDIRDLINETMGNKHNTKKKVPADESNYIRDLINGINTLQSDINKITEYLKDVKDSFKSSKRIEEIRIVYENTNHIDYRLMKYHQMLCDEIKAKYGL